MVLTQDARAEIKGMLTNKLLQKIGKHKFETEYKPFFQAIFNKKQIATASLIQSFYTSFGMSIYEQIAVALSKNNRFVGAQRQYILLGKIDKPTEKLISKIHFELRNGKQANSKEEVRLIRNSIKVARPKKDPDSVVDLYLKDKSGKEYFFGITTVKPNKEGFETHKRKLLRWVALKLSQGKNAEIAVATVLPYNPYYPEQYARFGSSALFDQGQFLVQEDFWDFVGGKGAFKELVEICSEIGQELRQKIDSI